MKKSLILTTALAVGFCGTAIAASETGAIIKQTTVENQINVNGKTYQADGPVKNITVNPSGTVTVDGKTYSGEGKGATIVNQGSRSGVTEANIGTGNRVNTGKVVIDGKEVGSAPAERGEKKGWEKKGGKKDQGEQQGRKAGRKTSGEGEGSRVTTGPDGSTQVQAGGTRVEVGQGATAGEGAPARGAIPGTEGLNVNVPGVNVDLSGGNVSVKVQ